jgi:hypothetical protein
MEALQLDRWICGNHWKNFDGALGAELLCSSRRKISSKLELKSLEIERIQNFQQFSRTSFILQNPTNPPSDRYETSKALRP